MELLQSGRFLAGTGGSRQPITCEELLWEQRMVFAGLADGNIACWRRRNDAPQGNVDSKPMILPGHTGLVRCLLVARQDGLGSEGCLLFSGSADRTVRVWDPLVRDSSKALVQTLRGHGGTVTCLAYSSGVLITSSTDKTIRVWKADEGRELLLYPWFSPHQVISDLDGWVNALALHLGESGTLYMADEIGNLCSFRVALATRTTPLTLTRWRRQPKAHALGITHVQLVPEEQYILTAGYDQLVKVWDSSSGVMVLSIPSEGKCRASALFWDSTHRELVLGDEMGYLSVWDVATERCLKRRQLFPEELAGGDRATLAIRDLKMAAGEVSSISISISSEDDQSPSPALHSSYSPSL